VRDYHAATAPYAEAGGYVNFMAGDDGGRVRDNYRAHYQRLAEIKARYDPGNLFHLESEHSPCGLIPTLRGVS
jgi:Berberine and berberine like